MSLNDRISDIARKGGYFLVSSEQVPDVDLLPHIIQAGIIAVGDGGRTDALHHTLHAARVVFHGQPIDAEDAGLFRSGNILVGISIAICGDQNRRHR